MDGDTVIVGTFWRRETLRLGAIDCPENDQYWGDTAKYGLIKLIGGREILLEEHTTDRYGRTVATIHVWHQDKAQWINVNMRMVTLGHAWVFRGFLQHLPGARRDELFRLERWARTNKIGLWKDPNPIPPWKWRNGDKRAQRSEDVMDAGGTTAEPADSPQVSAARDEPFLSPAIGIDLAGVFTKESSADAGGPVRAKRKGKPFSRPLAGFILVFSAFGILALLVGGPDAFTSVRNVATSTSRHLLESDYVYVTALAANVRGGPSMSNEVTDVVKQEKQLELLETKGNWHKVRDPVTKRVGWIHRSIVSRRPAPR